MPKHWKTVPAGPPGEVAGPTPLPDLTGVDLPALRDRDDPALLAAVDSVLRHPLDLAVTWGSDDGGDEVSRPARQPAETGQM